MKQQKILILESDTDLRETQHELMIRRGLQVVSVGTVDEAIDELRKGGIDRFRTNFMNDEDGRVANGLYAMEAITEAVHLGIRTDIWSLYSPESVKSMVDHEYSPEIAGKIHFYERDIDSNVWFTSNEQELGGPGIMARRSL